MTPGKRRLKAGDMPHHVQVQRPSRTTLSQGERVVTDWTTVASRYASVEALSGRELWLAQQVQADATYRIRMRPVPGLDASWSVLWGARRFLFSSPPLDPIGDGEQVELMCVEQTS